MNIKNISYYLGIGLISLTLVGCGNKIDNPPKNEPSITNPNIYDGIKEDSNKIKLTAPFSIYNEDGSIPTDLKYKGSKLESNTFTNLYKAIRIAGENSSTKVKLQVQDSNFNQIFKRTKASNWYVFDGHDYVGNDIKSNALTYTEKHKNSYAVSGDGKGYSYLGREDYREDMNLQSNILELNAGAYNYMFSTTGVGKGENGTNINGFAYANANVRLSEMKYRQSEDGDHWNAYIFFNLQAKNHADLGLIGTVSGDKLVWKLFRNCGSKSHGTQGFFVYQDKIITTSKYYDSATKEYSGCDDLNFEAVGYSNGWILNVTNLATGKVESFSDLHYEEDGKTPLVENGDDVTTYYRVLVASSYCPVVGNVWNWDCGAKTENVVWDNIKISRYIGDDITEYRKDSTIKYDFYPDTDLLRDGYSQGAFASSFEYGTRKEDGKYKSGNTYKKGDKYLIQNVCYTNKW